VDQARRQTAKLLNAQPAEIIFTAGATESNNMALDGVVSVYREKGDHVITQVTEHKSVLDPFKALEKKGLRVTRLSVDSHGLISPDELRATITDRTILISIMAANNEIGTVQPLEAIGGIAKEKNVFFHTDAAQAVGKIPIDVQAMGIDLLSISGHKMYAPKGVGALYVRSKNPRVRLEPLIVGGGQEGGLRSGTLNVPGIVGLGVACEIAGEGMKEEAVRLGKLRDRLLDSISASLKDLTVNGHPEHRLPGNLSVSFAGVGGESLLMALGDEIAVSAGSACSSARVEPSYVLKALRIPEDRIHGSVRFGLGRFTTAEEIDYTARKVSEIVTRLREISPLS